MYATVFMLLCISVSGSDNYCKKSVLGSRMQSTLGCAHQPLPPSLFGESHILSSHKLAISQQRKQISSPLISSQSKHSKKFHKLSSKHSLEQALDGILPSSKKKNQQMTLPIVKTGFNLASVVTHVKPKTDLLMHEKVNLPDKLKDEDTSGTLQYFKLAAESLLKSDIDEDNVGNHDILEYSGDEDVESLMDATHPIQMVKNMVTGLDTLDSTVELAKTTPADSKPEMKPIIQSSRGTLKPGHSKTDVENSKVELSSCKEGLPKMKIESSKTGLMASETVLVLSITKDLTHRSTELSVDRQTKTEVEPPKGSTTNLKKLSPRNALSIAAEAAILARKQEMESVKNKHKQILEGDSSISKKIKNVSYTEQSNQSITVEKVYPMENTTKPTVSVQDEGLSVLKPEQNVLINISKGTSQSPAKISTVTLPEKVIPVRNDDSHHLVGGEDSCDSSSTIDKESISSDKTINTGSGLNNINDFNATDSVEPEGARKVDEELVNISPDQITGKVTKEDVLHTSVDTETITEKGRYLSGIILRN